MKKKKYIKKYDLGTQQVTVPPKGGFDDVAGSTVSMAATGATVGSAFGPWGTVIGGAVGATGGAVMGFEKMKRKNEANSIATQTNKYIRDYNRSEDPHLQKFQAKNGLDMTKYKPKYPKGTKAVKTQEEAIPEGYEKMSPELLLHLRGLHATNPGAYSATVRDMAGITGTHAPAGSELWKQQNEAWNQAHNMLQKGYVKTLQTPTADALKSQQVFDSQFNPGQGNLNISSNEKLQDHTNLKQTVAGAILDNYNNKDGIDKTSPLKGLYKKGTESIHIKPENKGKFTAYKKRTGKTTEEALHSSDPHVRQMANFAKNAAKWHHKAEDGLNVEESKPIEVEKDELIFSKKGPRYNLKADFKGGKTHEQGGEPYTAKEGDVIFPGHMRKKVLGAYKKGDFASLETMRLKLPKDTAKKAEDGLDYNGTSRGTGDREAWLMKHYGNGYNESSPVTNVIENSSSFDTSKGMNAASGLIQATPTIYNSIHGAFGKVQQPTRRYLSPNLLKYQDLSNPNRQVSLETYNVDKANINNFVGTRGQQLGHLSQAGVANYNRQSTINNDEIARHLGINNENNQILNNAQAQNLALANEYDNQYLQNQAKQTEFLGKGMEGAASLALIKEQMNNQKAVDKIKANSLNSDNFTTDANGNVYYKTGNYKNGKQVHLYNNEEYYNNNGEYKKFREGTTGIKLGNKDVGVKKVTSKYKMKKK